MKKMWLVMVLAIALTGHGAYYDSGTLITFNEPITVRVMDMYCKGFDSVLKNDIINSNYENDWVITNVVGNVGYYNYTSISNDYQMELTPNTIGGAPFYTTYELSDIPSKICVPWVIYNTYGGTPFIPCQRLIGYLVNDRWLDKDGNDITDEFALMEYLNELRNRQRMSRLAPEMQLRSIISMVENEPKISFDIVYSGEKIVWGKKELTDNKWVDVTDMDKSEYRFFKVTIKSN